MRKHVSFRASDLPIGRKKIEANFEPCKRYLMTLWLLNKKISFVIRTFNRVLKLFILLSLSLCLSRTHPASNYQSSNQGSLCHASVLVNSPELGIMPDRK